MNWNKWNKSIYVTSTICYNTNAECLIARARVWFLVKPEFFQVFFFNLLGCSFYCKDHVHFHNTLSIWPGGCRICLNLQLLGPNFFKKGSLFLFSQYDSILVPLSLCKFTLVQRKGLFTTAIQSLTKHAIPTFMLQKLNPTSTSQLPSFLRSAKLSQTKQ